MRLLAILGGCALLFFAGRGILDLTNLGASRYVLVSNTPVFFDLAGRHWNMPGRVFGGLFLSVLIALIAAGAWLLRLGFARDEDERD